MNKKDCNQTAVTYDVYIGNVPKIVSETELKHLFYKYGEVKQVLCRWKDDYFGYGIVKFMYKQDADRVLRDNTEVSWNGHVMPVRMAKRSDPIGPNGSLLADSKQCSSTDGNKNQLPIASKNSNTDYGYFHAPPYMEDAPPVKLEILCTTVEDAITFYGYPTSRCDEFLLVMSTLQSLQGSLNQCERKPSPKKIYAALYSEDNSWYRCSILHTSLPNKPGMCLVRYIDYGNREEVSCKNIVEIPESLQKMPPFALKFVFANLVCERVVGKKSILHSLINKRLLVHAFPSVYEYNVVKCSCDGRDVIAETFNRNFAKSVSRAVPLKRDLPSYDSSFKRKAFVGCPEVKLPKAFPMGPNHANSLKKEEILNINNKKTRKVIQKPKEASSKVDSSLCNGNIAESKKEEFHPKIIMKRGTEISDLFGNISLNSATVNPPKEKTIKASCQQQHSGALIDSIIPNLKLINNIRGLVSQSADDSIIDSAVELLQNEIKAANTTENAAQHLDEIHQEYLACLKVITSCTDQSSLAELKSKRDSCRSSLIEKLKAYLSSSDNTIFERKEKIQKTIMDLESNSNAWMNVQLNHKPASVDELNVEYKKVKDERWNLVSKTRTHTNEKHKQFMDLLATLQNEFYLNTLTDYDPESKSDTHTQSLAKPPSFSEKFNESLKELGKAVETEIQTLTLNKDTGCVSIIQWLLEVLDVYKEKIDVLCEVYENRYALFQELSKLPDIDAAIAELASLAEDVTAFSNELCVLSSGQATKDQLLVVRRNLHIAASKEDFLKTLLAKSAEFHFPELNVQRPELQLINFSKNKFLLKNWKSEYFVNLDCNSSSENFSYVSKFIDETIFIKECGFETGEEINAFIRKAVRWNEPNSDSLIKIKALFLKNPLTVCVVLPPCSTTLLNSSFVPSPFEGEKSCRILRQVLIGLRDAHAQGITLQSLHPLTVLLENDKAVLNFSSDPSHLKGNIILKGINFKPPEDKSLGESTDMYGFGCLVLWMLFPNLSFTSTSHGAPNIAAFRSIIEELILPKDYALLSALVDHNADRRPSSNNLLTKGFLSKYEAFCRSRCDSQKNA